LLFCQELKLRFSVTIINSFYRMPVDVLIIRLQIYRSSVTILSIVDWIYKRNIQNAKKGDQVRIQNGEIIATIVAN